MTHTLHAFLFASACALIPADEPPTAQAPAVKRQGHFVLFESGPGARPAEKSALLKMQEGHIGNLSRLAEAGQCTLAGPTKDGGTIRGIVLLDLPADTTLEEAFAPDPFVEHEILRVRSMAIDLTTGKPGKAEEPFVLDTFVLGLARADVDTDLGEARTAFRELERALAGLEDSPLAIAGVTTGDREIVGILLFGTEDKDRVRDLVDAHSDADAPLGVTLFGQFLARGCVPKAPEPKTEATDGE